MREIVLRNEYNKIKLEIKKMKNYIIRGKIEGLIVGIEEMQECLITNDKEIISPLKKMGLHTLLFETSNMKDIDTFFEYLGQFSEGSMELNVYDNLKVNYEQPKCLKIICIDEESILVDRPHKESNFI